MIRIANIGCLVTMRDGVFDPIVDSEVHIVDSKIVYAGSRADAPAEHFVQEIDAGQGVVTPGLIDAHTHAVFFGDRANEFQLRSAGRTYQEIATAGGGIKSSVAATGSATEDDLVEAGVRLMQRMVRNGTTTLEVKSGYGLSPGTEAKMLSAAERAATHLGLTLKRTFLGLHAVPSGTTREQYVHDVTATDLYELAWDRCEFTDIFVETGYFTAQDAIALATATTKRGKRLRLHVDQLAEGGGAALAAELGAITADHLEYTSHDGIRAMAKANVIPVLLPASVHGLGKTRYPDACAMINAGLPVVLATDLNPGSSPCFSLPFCMNLAMVYMKMSFEESLRAVTTNAAKSLNLQESHGQLAPGFNADVIIWDAKAPREIPYWIGAELANAVFASGKLIYSRTN